MSAVATVIDEESQLRARVFTHGPVTDARSLLAEVLEEGRSGELVIVAGAHAARVHVEAGRIAWVFRPAHRPSVCEVLDLDPAALDADTVRALIAQSYASRRHFALVAAEMGLVRAEEVRSRLGRFLEGELAAVLEWSMASATFIDEHRAAPASFSFDAHELAFELPGAARSSVMPPTAAANSQDVDERVEALLDRVGATPGIEGCVVLDMRLGEALGARGSLRGASEVVWALARGFAALGADGEDLFARQKGAGFLVRRSEAEADAVLVVAFDPEVMLPGMARLRVRDAIAG